MQRVNHAPRLTGKSHFPFVWELVARILLFLNPIDIISMRKVSRNIYKVTTSRLVWVAALERICELHGLFRPTYPLDKMSLSELEYAALAPYRFVKTVKEHQYGREIPASYQTRIVQLRVQPGPCIEEHSPERIYLIPGGRFCFTTEKTKVYLWDLGYGVQKLINPFPLVTLNVNLHSVTSTLDGKELILAVTAAESQANDFLRIYRVDPRSKTPNLHSQTELLDVSRGHIFLTSDNTAVLMSDNAIAIWNWVENTGARWKIPNSRGYLNIYPSNRTFTTYDDERTLCVWEYPALLPLPHSPRYSDILAVTNTPKLSSQLPNCDPTKITLSGTPSSQRGTFLNHYLCAIVDDEQSLEQDQISLCLFSIRNLVSGKNDPFIPMSLPVLCGVSKRIFGHGPEECHSTNPSPLFTCDGHLVFCSQSDAGSIVAAVLPTPKNALEEAIDTWSMSLTPPDAEFIPNIQHGFCPMSGRLVYCHADGPMEGQVYITDFLAPPPDL